MGWGPWAGWLRAEAGAEARARAEARAEARARAGFAVAPPGPERKLFLWKINQSETVASWLPRSQMS